MRVVSMAWESAGAAGVYLLLVNIATYAAFALDKRRSVEGQWRVREVSLLRLALFGGWPAAKLAQRRLRHKTRKQPFGRVLNRIGAAQLALMLLISMTGMGWTGTAMDWLSGRQWAGAGVAWLDALRWPEPEPEPSLPRRFGPGS